MEHYYQLFLTTKNKKNKKYAASSSSQPPPNQGFRVKRLNQANTKTKMNINKSCSKLTTTRKLIQLLLMPKISSSVSKSYKNVTRNSNGCKVAAKITRRLTRTLSERHFFIVSLLLLFYDSNILKGWLSITNELPI